MADPILAHLRPVKAHYNENLAVLGFEMSNGTYAQGSDDQDKKKAPVVQELPNEIIKVDLFYRKNNKLLHSMIFHGKDGASVHIGITDEMDEKLPYENNKKGACNTFEMKEGHHLLGVELHHNAESTLGVTWIQRPQFLLK